jgi:hypothetical protein
MRGIVSIVATLCLFVTPLAQAGNNGYQERNSKVICKVFGDYCAQALRVSRCESGLTVTAHNGQYLGLFQMGSSERATYGHHPSSPWVQARAAYRYFVASGRDWSPWSCKPW